MAIRHQTSEDGKVQSLHWRSKFGFSHSMVGLVERGKTVEFLVENNHGAINIIHGDASIHINPWDDSQRVEHLCMCGGRIEVKAGDIVRIKALTPVVAYHAPFEMCIFTK